MTLDKAVHALPVEHLAEALHTQVSQGLGQAEAQRRLSEHGANELRERPRPSFLVMLWGQLNNFLIIILIVASLVSLALGEVVDATAIVAIVVLNSILGLVQESRAERALAALKKMAAPNAQAIRDGHQVSIPSRELVPGDIVLLEAGNYVPADLRLVESVNLRIEEASLTGESAPVEKNAQMVLDRDIPLGDRKNSAFMGTLVSYGRGKGMVTFTGMATEIGVIAEMIQTYDEEPTPLQKRLEQLGKWLGTAALAICGVIFVIGIIRDTRPMDVITRGLAVYLVENQAKLVELFLTSVSLAIAAVPEGLPAVVTICLALGMQRMVTRHALVRKLAAVETLGSASVICSDKTGTLTQNQMTVVQAWTGGSSFRITGEGYDPRGTFSLGASSFSPLDDPTVAMLLRGALLCNDADLEESGASEGTFTWRVVGDPTEGALVVLAAKAGLEKEQAEREYPRVAEIPFDSERKRMTTVHAVPETDRESFGVQPGAFVAFVKGAPDVLLELCTTYTVDGEVRQLNSEVRQEIAAANAAMATSALRVLSVAFRPLSELPAEVTAAGMESNLTFVGLLGMLDQARPEVKSAVAQARRAGLKIVMVTGDYRDTAVAVASEIGLLTPRGRVLTGPELEAMSQDDFVKIVDEVDVYARSSPQHKVRLVDALKARGHVVAMTGDGVNDAPALKRANIGVAMGITGTDVSKEVADIVLTDDNFASIVSAIEQGRIIYSNIRKFVFLLVSCNIAEILVIFGAMLAGLPIPLRPIQLLWLNLVSDGAPALALGLEKGDPDVMQQPPRPATEPIINQEMLFRIVTQALADAVAVMGAFLLFLNQYPGHVELARTVAFATIVSVELLRAYSARSTYHSVFSQGLLSNPWMVLATNASFVMLLASLYVPVLQPVFGTVPLGLRDWGYLLPFVLFPFVVAEATKPVVRRMRDRGAVRR